MIGAGTRLGRYELLARIGAGAHASGIVHRDIKPENIMITTDGYAKVVDFGLAKLIDRESSDESDTITMQGTAPGKIFGTVRYMSPEQILCRRVDYRSDIFSFGCILYEAVTGHRAFDGTSDVEVLHRIAYEELDLSAITDTDVLRILRKCMAKAPDERYHSARDLAIDVRELHRPNSSGKRSVPPRAALRTPWLLAALAIPFVAALAIWRPTMKWPAPKAAGAESRPLEIELVRMNQNPQEAVISPDGGYVAYAAESNEQDSVWLRQLATSSTIRLFGPTLGHTSRLAFTNDGKYLFFLSWDVSVDPPQQAIYRVPILGGQPTKIVDKVTSAAVGPSGRLFAYEPMGVPLRPLLIRTPDHHDRQIATLSNNEGIFYPAFSPDEKMLAAVYAHTGVEGWRIRVWTVASSAMSVVGPPWRRLTGLAWSSDQRSMIVAGTRSGAEPGQIWRVSYPSGSVERLTHDNDEYFGVATTRLGIMVSTQAHTVASIWTVSRDDAEHPKRILSPALRTSNPSWLTNGRILYLSDVAGSPDLWTMNADGSDPVQVTASPEAEANASVSPDSRLVLFEMHRDGKLNIWLAEAALGATLRPLTHCNGCYAPRFSPDGKWVYYTSSDLPVMPAIFRTPVDQFLPERASPAVAAWPQPSPDGKRLLVMYWRHLPGIPRAAMLAAADGSVIRVLDRERPDARDYRWADGGGVFFIPTERVADNVWLLAPNGEKRQITKFTSESTFAYDYDPQRRAFVMARGVEQRNVVLIKNLR